MPQKKDSQQPPPSSAATSSSMLDKKPERPSAKMLWGVIAVFILVIIVGLLVVGVGIYRFNWQDQTIKKIARVLGYPAVLLNYRGLSYSEYADDVATLNHFYAAQEEQNPGSLPQPSADYLKKSVLSRMVREKFLEEEAQARGLTVSQSEIDNEFNTIVSQAGDEQTVTETLKNLYDWTSSQFKEKVLRPYLIRNKVQAAVANDETINAEARQRAEEVLAKLNAGEKFEDLAQQYSEDITASSGGDLGFFSKGQMVTEFEDAAFALEPGKTSGIVKTQYGYHIIKLIEKIAASGDTPEQLHAAHILIKAKDMDTWINEKLAKKKVIVLMSGLAWKKQCGLILAKTETCEQNELLNSPSSEQQAPTDTNTETNANTEAEATTDTNTTTNTNTGQ